MYENILTATKFIMIKRLIAIVAAGMAACLMALPAFAESGASAGSCSYNTDGTTASGDTAICTALGKLYGTGSTIPYSLNAATDTLTYGITITKASGPVTVYVKEKTTINDVGVAIGSDGKIKTEGIGSGDNNTWNQIYKKYKDIIVGVTGIATITFLVFFIINITKVGQNASNPNARSSALQGVLWCGIAAAALGSVTVIFGFFVNAI